MARIDGEMWLKISKTMTEHPKPIGRRAGDVENVRVLGKC